MEGYTPLTPAPVGGKRRKLKLVTKKAARKALKKLGMKMRGGEDAPVVADAKTDLPATTGGADPAPVQPTVAAAPAGGKRRHGGKTKRSASRKHRKASSLFGL